MKDFILDLAQCAGKCAMEYFGQITASDINSKATGKDLVSIADKAVEQEIISRIHAVYPDHGIFGEESGKIAADSRYCWIIDPIDGTQSFVKHHPFFSVSIALYCDGKPQIGCVHAPALDRTFLGICGEGAWENGKEIHVSNCTELEEAACASGFAMLRANCPHPAIDIFYDIAPRLRDIKRCGSAALDLCFVGAGIYDGYWEMGLAPYDVAAGSIIAREAGARVCDFDGNDTDLSGKIIAAPPEIAAKLLNLIRKNCQMQ